MKHTDVAIQYGIPPYKLDAYIRNHATFPIKERWGEIIIPDNVDIPSFIAPLLHEKEELARKTTERKLQRQQEEHEQQLQELKKQQAEQDRSEQVRIETEILERKRKEAQYHVRIEKLKSSGAEGYYEYKAVSLLDVGGLFSGNSGRVNTEAMTKTLNELGADGWRLVTAYSNELGKNALSGGASGVMLGVNSTVDENILIFERFIKF